jgi:MFS transporter, NNP family, nitrate/nitrite transporter
MAITMMLCSAATFGIAVVHNAAGYIAARFFIGLSLAVFVACQYWSSIMFSATVVGTANAVAGGWGNLGMSSHPVASSGNLALLIQATLHC